MYLQAGDEMNSVSVSIQSRNICHALTFKLKLQTSLYCSRRAGLGRVKNDVKSEGGRARY